MFSRNALLGALAASCAAFTSPMPASAAIYTYVGSWILGQGPHWTDNPQVYSGREAAAFIFGGSASNYVISTIDANVSNINFKTWLDGWGDPTTYAYSMTPGSDTFSLDTGGSGYNSNPGYKSSYSAFIRDHFDGSDTRFTNYAFAVSGAVPEPSTWAMMLIGFAGLGYAGYRKRRTASITA